MVRNNKQLIFGIVMCFLAIIYLALIPYQVSTEPILGAGGRDKINGAFFPVIAGVFLLISSIAMTLRTIKSKKDGSSLRMNEFAWAAFIVAVGIIYVVLIGKIRYLPPTIGVLLLLCYLLRPEGMKKYMYVVYPVSVACIIYFVFSKLFYVALP